MTSKSIWLLSLAAIAATAYFVAPVTFRPPSGSCSTFVLSADETLLVGHNLDESMEVPGLVVANPRGLAKENRTYDEVKSGRRAASAPRLAWVSKYGSLTYNVFGREFPDGGMNEAGLYVGEMTLLATTWPKSTSVPRLYHHQWIQYLLDNFSTVEEALGSLSKALPEGHCRWHFLLADKRGDVAVVEFLEGRPVVYRGGDLPFPILANDAYKAEIEDIVRYAGFGGAKDPIPRYEREDPRFRWAAVMLADTTDTRSPVERAFAILKRLDTVGSTKWSLVHDLRKGRLVFQTSRAPKRRWVDLAAFDFACTGTPSALDLQKNMEGDVAGHFSPLSEAINARAIADAWGEIDAGSMGNVFWKPRMIAGMRALPGSFACAAAGKP